LRLVRIAAACVLASLTLALPTSAEANHASNVMVAQINKVRARHGLPPLRSSPSLNRSSRRFARTMIRRDFFGHRSRVSASRRFRRLGEALAMHSGRRPGVRGTLRGWLRSPSHRKLVLTRSRRYVGAGMARGRLGRGRAVIWVMQVGKL
jgi:uncharacterized protein YkwD